MNRSYRPADRSTPWQRCWTDTIEACRLRYIDEPDHIFIAQFVSDLQLNLGQTDLVTFELVGFGFQLRVERGEIAPFGDVRAPVTSAASMATMSPLSLA